MNLNVGIDLFNNIDLPFLLKIIIAVAISLVAFFVLGKLLKIIGRIVVLIIIFIVVMYLLNML